MHHNTKKRLLPRHAIGFRRRLGTSTYVQDAVIGMLLVCILLCASLSHGVEDATSALTRMMRPFHERWFTHPMRNAKANMRNMQNRTKMGRNRIGGRTKRRMNGAPMNSWSRFVPPETCIGLPQGQGTATSCKRVVQVQHNERWAGIPSILALVRETAEGHNFDVASPYVSGGSMVRISHPKALPISSYFTLDPFFSRCDTHGRQVVVLSLERQPWIARVEALNVLAKHASDSDDGHAPLAGAEQVQSKASKAREAAVKELAEGRAAVRTTPFDPHRDEIPMPFWCNGGKLCVMDWTPCEVKHLKQPWRGCPAWNSTPPGLMGRIISNAFDFLERSCAGSRYVIATPLAGTWYKRHVRGQHQVVPIHSISPGIMQATARLADLNMRCPPGKEVSAMLRICQEPLYRKPVAAIAGRCERLLSQINALSAALQPVGQQVCRHFLASDYYVMADNAIPKKHHWAVQRCFENLKADYENRSKWFNIDATDIQRAIRGLPEMQHAYRKDKPGFHAIVEVGMMVRADVCMERSHLAQSLANIIRSKMGKPRCLHVGESVDVLTRLSAGVDSPKESKTGIMQWGR